LKTKKEKEVKLKPGVLVDVTIEADKENTTEKE
jgi:hypothetical protein